MNLRLKKAVPVAVTLVAVIAALLIVRHLWRYYMDEPWTRDAHVNAEVIQLAPDVSGLVTAVNVKDNAPVKQGDVLFVIDQARYRIALEQAQAALAQAQAALLQTRATVVQLQRETERDRQLKDLVAVEDAEARRANLEKGQAAVVAAQASIATAQAAVDLAKLNLQRTEVRSPINGRVNDHTVRLGDYVAAGKAVMAVLDTNSFRVDGYFEETRLRHIKIGDPVSIQVMGESKTLRGHVQSIAAGIEDRYRSDGSSLLPNVTPAFDWVRLAQRIPVRIDIDEVPRGVTLIAGRTATVSVSRTLRDGLSPQAAR
jgi:multidrug resistance efflux pump